MAQGRVGIRPYSGQTTSIDTDAQAFITASALTDTGQKNAINELVLDLKATGVWTKMKALYPMIGGTATTHKFNLKDPRDLDAAFRLQFNGGWTHSATGATPNGSNAYADTKLVPNSALTLYNNHMSFYSRTNTNVGGGTDIGGQWQQTSPQLAATFYQFNGANLNGTAIGSISTNDPYRITYSQTQPASFVMTNRTANNSLKMFQNGILKGTNTTVNTSTFNVLPRNNTYISAFNLTNDGVSSINNYSNKQCAFASIGNGLTDLESNLFYQIVEKYQYALGRNVNATQSFYYNSSYSNETNAYMFRTGLSNESLVPTVSGMVFGYDAKFYTSGTTWTDLSGNGYNATLQNGVTYSTANEGSFNYDGIDDKILTGYNGNLTQQFSSSVWFYSKSTPSANSVRALISKSVYWAPATTDFPYALYLNTAGTSVSGMISNGTAYSITAPSNGQTVNANVNVNQWNNVVITYDRVNLKAYVNGVLVDTKPCSVILPTNSNYWAIGRASYDYSGGVTMFDSKISQVFLYNRALTDTEALKNYNSTKARYGL